MLKTTMETGDIGIFTIKPVKTSASITTTSNQHGIQGSRSQNHLSMRRSVDDFRRQDERHQPPSCRDTTSEILSLYGSNSYSSANSVFSHLMDDQNQRSFSLTTVGSRHLSHNKSSNTLQSHYSGGPLQRPQSPFPYPTRLKRPGARPASPAITESGVVDYSRMVEIDRISLVGRSTPIRKFCLICRLQIHRGLDTGLVLSHLRGHIDVYHPSVRKRI